MYIQNTSTNTYDLDDSGKYPTGPYVLNTTLSSCLAGGEVTTYNNVTGAVIFNITGADECAVYFDLVLPNLISFDYGDKTYYAEEGMTWFEFINSSYNAERDGTYFWASDSGSYITRPPSYNYMIILSSDGARCMLV